MKTEGDFIYLPKPDIHKASGIVMRIVNHWWQVHPGRGLMFFPYGRKHPDIKNASPQCNLSKGIVERLRHPFAEVEFFESVVYPIDIHSYAS